MNREVKTEPQFCYPGVRVQVRFSGDSPVIFQYAHINSVFSVGSPVNDTLFNAGENE